jgi:hypothetical protein
MTTALLPPIERLALSRERLRRAMTRRDAPKEQSSATGNKALGLGLLDALKLAVPSAGLIIDAVAQWLDGHPLKASSNFVEGVANEVLRPLAKRHPFALVAGAVAVGALLVWSRPWRWVLKPHVLNTWGPAVLSSAIASSALQNWLSGILSKTTVPQQPPPQPPSQQAAPEG